MRFSQKKGLKPVASEIQRDGVSEELRNTLWNVLDLHLWQQEDFMRGGYHTEAQMFHFSAMLWLQYFKKPMDERPRRSNQIHETIRTYFFAAPWFEVYDFLEWVLNFLDNSELVADVNLVLEQELSGYRFVDSFFAELTDKEEISSLEEALADDRFAGVRAHLLSALRLFSDRKTPDYRNSIKESISAVESMAQIVTGDPKATLGDALAVLERKKELHGALKEGFKKLYGYTSDEGGIRHAMLEEPNLTAADARYFLLSCTSFTNYLKSLI